MPLILYARGKRKSELQGDATALIILIAAVLRQPHHGKSPRSLLNSAYMSRFFTPHLVRGLRRYMQDGGLWRNNPSDIGTDIAKETCPRISKPDMALSLGTGYQAGSDGLPSPSSPATPIDLVRAELRKVSPRRGYDHFVKRIVHSFLSSAVMDGDKFHALSGQLSGSANAARRSFRLNVELPEMPSLDDVASMETLRIATYAQHSQNKELDTIADILVSTLFYFELTAWPVRHRSKVSCRGRILCDIEPGPILEHFIKELQQRGYRFNVAGSILSLSGSEQQDLSTETFKLPVEVSARNLDDSFTILLCKELPGPTAHQISASPFQFRGLLRAQGWSSHFGRADNGPLGPEDETRKRKSGAGHFVSSKRVRV